MTASGGTLDGKAGFDHLYNQPDPRGYFQTLSAFSYEIPHHAHSLFDALLAARRGREHGSILDICCSYGVNAALLRCDLSLDDLYSRYCDAGVADVATDALIDDDRRFYADRLRPNPPRMLGLDVADRAVRYAREAGLLDAGWAENLETNDPPASLAEEIGDVDLVTITGGVGYITERTFERLLRLFPEGRKPWVAAFVLRMYSYDRIAETLARHGLVTEHLEGVTFPQRRFATPDEEEAALRGVRTRGLDPHGREDDGWYYCDFFLSRPRAEVDQRPLEELLADAPLSTRPR